MSYATVADLRAYLPQVPEYGQQRITPTGASVVLTYEGTATASLSAAATATTIQTALRAITAIGASGVNVQGPPGGPWVASFQGALATNAALLTATGASVAPATDDLLQDCLDRATDTIRQALRAMLADPTFDWTAWPAASTKIVRGYSTGYLPLPPHQAGSVTLAEYMSTSNPAAYAAVPDQWIQEDGSLYRAGGWTQGRYRVTAVWGYGPDVPPTIEQLTLELAVNIWRSRDKGGFSEIVGADGGGAVRQVAGLNKQQQATLQSIRDQLWAVAI